MKTFLEAWFVGTFVGGSLFFARWALSDNSEFGKSYQRIYTLMKCVQGEKERKEFQARHYVADDLETLNKLEKDIYKELNKWSQQERI